ncbi:MAG: hypothetical protein AAB864_01695, partial [Patescibacteria group bacterium]
GKILGADVQKLSDANIAKFAKSKNKKVSGLAKADQAWRAANVSRETTRSIESAASSAAGVSPRANSGSVTGPDESGAKLNDADRSLPSYKAVRQVVAVAAKHMGYRIDVRDESGISDSVYLYVTAPDGEKVKIRFSDHADVSNNTIGADHSFSGPPSMAMADEAITELAQRAKSNIPENVARRNAARSKRDIALKQRAESLAKERASKEVERIIATGVDEAKQLASQAAEFDRLATGLQNNARRRNFEYKAKEARERINTLANLAKEYGVDEKIVKKIAETAAQPQQPSESPKPVAPVAEAAHVEDDKIEEVTGEVIRESVAEGAANTELTLPQQREFMLAELDKAIAKAESKDDLWEKD